MENLYNQKCKHQSDINEHLPVLREYATKCNSVVECGVRDIVSSYAFAMGLKETPNNYYVLVDPYKSGQIDDFLKLCKSNKVNASFIEQSDLTCPIINTDLLFIDTWHVYGQLKRELARWNGSVNKYIIMHDTSVDELHGETIRLGLNAVEQSKKYGIPVDEINKGIWFAVEEFLQQNKNWVIEKRFVNNNGLTILKRV
jgi:hypothetical protein